MGLFLLAACVVASRAGVCPAQLTATDVARWLEEEGRAYAQSSQATGTNADARIVRALMQAASSMAERLAEPYRWQYEMAVVLGDDKWAHEALRGYTTFRPTDLTRRLLWIESELAQKQTAEERLEFLQNMDQMVVPAGPLVRSEIFRRQAAIQYGQGDIGAADGNIQAALREYPNNSAARQLEEEYHELVPPDQTGAIQLLRLAGFSPGDWQVALRLARELDCLGMREEATPWYEQTRRLLERAGAGAAVLAEILLEMARSAKSDDDSEKAWGFCTQAIGLAPESVAPRILLTELCHDRGDDQACEETRAWLRQHHEELAGSFGERPDLVSAAALSWYHARVEGAADKAVFYAERALELDPDHPVAQSCAGYAYLCAGRLDEAIERLTPVAAVDPLTAAALGRALCESGRTDEGAALLEQVITDCASGAACEEARAALEKQDRTIPPPPDTTRVLAEVKRFEHGRREYPFDPDRYLIYRVEPLPPITDPLQNWTMRFAILNRGEFDITIGPGAMLNPMFVISIELSGDAFAQFEEYMTVNLDETPVLRPGQVIDVVRTVDTGPLRDFLWRTVQADYEVRVRVLLDPMRNEQGRSVPAPWAPSEYEFTFRRPGLAATPGNIDHLIAASQSQDIRARIPATRKLIALWAEQQAYGAGPKAYRCEPVPVERIREAVMKRTDAQEDPLVVAYTLSALRTVHLGNEEITRLAALLHHKAPLVRLQAVLLFADQQGPAFLPVAASLAERDPATSVRDICGGFRDNWAQGGVSGS